MCLRARWSLELYSRVRHQHTFHVITWKGWKRAKRINLVERNVFAVSPEHYTKERAPAQGGWWRRCGPRSWALSLFVQFTVLASSGNLYNVQYLLPPSFSSLFHHLIIIAFCSLIPFAIVRPNCRFTFHRRVLSASTGCRVSIISVFFPFPPTRIFSSFFLKNKEL